MAEITQKLLEQLIDCQEHDIPSARIIQLMASEIMRMRGYGDMVPAPEKELVQRSLILMKAIKNDPVVDTTFLRLGNLLQPKLKIDCYETLKDILNYVGSDTPLSDDSDWIDVNTDLLNEAERVIHDAIGFGTSHGHLSHNNSLNAVRKFIENSGGSFSTLVPKELIKTLGDAVGEIVYGKIYSMSTREKLQEKLHALLKEEVNEPSQETEA